MSVINQVLNQLEQRGVHTTPEQTMVRAVPPGKHWAAMPLLALGLALAGGIAAWQWIQMRPPKTAAGSAAQLQPVVATPAPVSAVSPSAVMEAAASAVIAVEAPPVEMLLPASRLSFELSSIPLPSALRQGAVLHGTGNGAIPGSATEPAAGEVCPEPCLKGAGLAAKAVPQARPARAQPMQAAPSDVRPVVPRSSSAPPMKQVSPAQRTDAEFRKAVALMQQGHIADAIAGYETVLRLDAGHDAARQALVALLLEGKRGAEAGRVLQDGLKNRPGHTGFAMLLARLQVEDGALDQAMATLEKSLPYADSQAGYHAFFAALLQRLRRHKEAITHYQIVLQLVPDNGIWLMGYGISLQEVQRNDDARDAFGRALGSKTLSPELQTFVQQKLKEL